MADSVTTQVLFSSPKRYVALFTNVSDGTGEAAVAKVDISALEGAPARVSIRKIKFSTFGMSVSILYDHDADDRVFVANGEGEWCFPDKIKDPASAGGTGDILFTTNGHTAGDTYSILLDLELQ